MTSSTTTSIYRTQIGKQALETLYREAVDELSTEVEDKWVDTRFGQTHLLVAGEKDAPPLLIFHGGNTTNPITLAWFEQLADEYRIFAPDTIGQPGFSSQTRVDPTGDELGKWVVDVLDALEFGSVPMIGPSYGAGIILRTASYAPERISKAVLVMPAGLAMNSPLKLGFSVGLPAILYGHVSHSWLINSVIKEMFTQQPDEVDSVTKDTLKAVFQHVKLEHDFPGVSSPDELAGYSAPTFVIAGANDPFFPANRVVQTAREYIQSIEREHIFSREKHFLSPTAIESVQSMSRHFLKETSNQ